MLRAECVCHFGFFFFLNVVKKKKKKKSHVLHLLDRIKSSFSPRPNLFKVWLLSHVASFTVHTNSSLTKDCLMRAVSLVRFPNMKAKLPFVTASVRQIIQHERCPIAVIKSLCSSCLKHMLLISSECII